MKPQNPNTEEIIYLEFLHSVRESAPGGYTDLGLSAYRRHASVESFLAYKNPKVKVAPQKQRAVPTSCPSIVSPAEFPSIRLDASEVVADEKLDWISPFWLHYTPDLVLPEFFSADDLIEPVLPGYGPQVKRFSLLKKNLASFSKINPNPLLMDEVPPRKFFVGRWYSLPLVAILKRISWLRQFAELRLVTFEHATGAVEAWYDTQKLSAAKVIGLYSKAVSVHCDPRCGLKNWRAIMPGSPSTSGRSCLVDFRNLGLVRDASHYEGLTKRNWVLFLDAKAPKGKK